MAEVLQKIASFAGGLSWRGKLLAVLGTMLVTEAAYEVYLVVRREIERRKSQKHFSVVRFSNRRVLANGPSDVFQMKMGNIAYLISYIDRAQRTISMSMYILTITEIRDALIRAAKERSVTVRIVCCDSMVYNEGSQIRHMTEDCFVRFKVNSDYLMHHKFCLIDADWLCADCLVKEHLEQTGKACKEMQFTMFDRAVLDNMPNLVKTFGSSCVRCDSEKRKSPPKCSVSNPLPRGGCLITGSSNWTMPALSSHWDNMIFTSLPELVRPFAVEFQRQWYELSDMHDASDKK